MSNEHLKSMVDALIDGNTEQAQVAFHSYLTTRMKDQLNPSDPAPVIDDKKVDDKKAGTK